MTRMICTSKARLSAKGMHMFNFRRALLPWNGEHVTFFELQRRLCDVHLQYLSEIPLREASENYFSLLFNISGLWKNRQVNCA